ncbi:MAG: CHAT domain-containing tetratricopeptide repeat protein [Bryobacteraceae bacterium]
MQRSDRLEEALKLADRGLAASRGNPSWFHRFRILKAELLVMEELPEQALDLLDAPPQISLPDTPEFKAGYLYVRGYALSRFRRYPEARSLLEKAREVAASSHLPAIQSTVLVRLGTVWFSLGDRAKAEECYTSALAQADAARDSYLQARAYDALGFLDLNNSHYDECAIRSERALHTYQTLGAEILTARVSVNLGWCDYRLGKHEEAQALFANAQRIFTQQKLWSALTVNLNANGAEAVARGDLPAARDYYQKVVDLATKTDELQNLAEGRGNLATVLIQMGDLNAGEEINNQAQSVPADHVQYETRLRMKLNSGRIAAARGKLADAEAICRSVANSGIPQPKFVIDADQLLAKVLEREKRPQEAEAALKQALSELDNSRADLFRDESKLTYTDSLIQVSRDYVDLLFTQNRPSEALEVAESSRARLLSEQSNVAKAFPKWDEFVELARKTNTVFLFYWIAPVQSHLWAITPAGEIEHKTLPADTAIRSMVDSYRRFIDGFGDTLSGPNPGRELSTALIGQVQQLVPQGAHLVIVPDGPLFDINFESLPVQTGGAHYWLRDVTVSVAPSLSLFLRPDDAVRPAHPRLLLIGDALSASQKDFPRLENAGKEIERIRAQFPSGDSVLRTGAAATPDAYAEAKPADFTLIHFAAHATANQESPLDSAVVLTPRRGNYKLYAREIRNHRIQADLVTISACRSAGARTYAGEGLVGFAWSFLAAGARNVVAGLWEVDDRSTAQLMESMYRELRRGAPPAEALRQAKLELAGSSSSFRKPYYWAPFQLFTVSLQ